MAALGNWYPGIAVGTASCYLRERFYAERVVLDDGGEDEARRDFIVILYQKGNKLAGMLSAERDADSEVLQGRVGVISPQHRGAHLSKIFPLRQEMMGRSMDNGMVYPDNFSFSQILISD